MRLGHNDRSQAVARRVWLGEGNREMGQTVNGENRYEIVFGETFALYTREEYLEFMEPFKVRYERNGLPMDMFRGKRCLDAGCGNGRGSLFMLMGGAESVTSLDFSHKNVESATRFLSDFGYHNFVAQQGNLEDIPFEDQSFDFVWCNGVVMHTQNPNKCLSELSRVLKVGGGAWLYIYGSGGVYWRIIQQIRTLVGHIPAETCIQCLRLLRYETRYVAEFIDDWYATHLRTYTAADLGARLGELGFTGTTPLKFGMDYDSSHRIHTYGTPEERVLMGEGDLRYLLHKKEVRQESNHLLLEGEYGSDYSWPQIITEQLNPLFAECAALCGSDMKKIAFAAHLQRELRLLLTQASAFTLQELVELQSKLKEYLGAVRGLDG